MADNPTFQIPRDVIEPIIQAQVAAALAAVFVDKTSLIDAAVARVLQAKVNHEGKITGYSSDTTPWIQWVVNDCLKQTVKAVIEEEVAKQKDVIRKHISAQLRDHKSPLVRQLVEGMTNALTNESTLKYRLTVVADKY